MFLPENKGAWPMDANEPVAIYTTNNANEAEVLKTLLEGEGIRTLLDGENQGSFSGVLPVQILVPAGDEQRARQVLADHEYHHTDADEEKEDEAT
jgi:hypothetical protein